MGLEERTFIYINGSYDDIINYIIEHRHTHRLVDFYEEVSCWAAKLRAK